MKVSKTDLFKSLESVLPGVAREGGTLEQAQHFIFKDGVLMTYNDEVSCKSKSPFNKEIEGAVKADKLLDVLKKIPDGPLEAEISGNQLVLSGKNRKSKFLLEKEILLPIGSLEIPGDWGKLNPDFCSAVVTACSCAGTDESSAVVFLHIHPEWIEATDRYQILRWDIDLGIKNPILIRASSIKKVVDTKPVEWSNGEKWIHFRTEDGLVLSCRKYENEKYPELSKFLDGDGVPVKLPREISDAARAAAVFSSEREGMDLLRVDLKKGKIRVVGEGVTGSHEEWTDTQYSGGPVSFYLNPRILSRLSEQETNCELLSNPSRLLVRYVNYIYTTCLLQPEKEE